MPAKQVKAQPIDLAKAKEQLGEYLDSGVIAFRTTFAAESEEALNLPKLPEGDITLTKSQYRSVVKICERLAAYDGLASNFIESMVEMNAAGFENRVATQGKENYKVIFDTCCKEINSGVVDKSRGMDEVEKKYIRNWWVSGLLVWLFRVEPRVVTAMKSRSFVMPIEAELLEATRVDLDKLKTEGIVAYEFPDDQKKELVKWVEQDKKDPAQHRLLSIWPKTKPTDAASNVIDQTEAYSLIKSGKPVPLPPDKYIMVRRIFKDSQIYPVPYLIRYFPAVEDKQTLRTMDRSIMRKIINLILLIKVKAQNEHAVVTQEMLETAANGVKARFENAPNRVQIAAVPWTQEYEYVSVPGDTLYKRDHYRVLNYEALIALLGPAANQLLTESGSVDISLLAKILYGKNEICLQSFRRFVEEVYDRFIIAPSKLQLSASGVNLVFKRLSIFEADAFKQFIGNGVKYGYIPARVAIDHIGEDYDSIVEQLEEEARLRAEKGIFVGYPIYNQTTTKNPSERSGTTEEKVDDAADDAEENSTTMNPDGRPEGSEDTVDSRDTNS
jgi:hypothetical protein